MEFAENAELKQLLKETIKYLYLALSKFQKAIEEHTERSSKTVGELNAKNETNKYLKQGLVDRAVTRDLRLGHRHTNKRIRR